MKETFDTIRKSGKLIFEYIRGSHAYGLNIDTSDVDTGGVYILDDSTILGLRENYIPQISDEKHDNIWYEIGRFLELAMSSNPNILEALFVPEECILYCAPEMKLILDNKEKFLSKKIFGSLNGYSYQQIVKAQGLNKKINQPMVERKTPIDFCYTFNDNQGTESILQWLEKHGLKQKYCGLNHMPNMNQMYGVFYDWQQHLRMEFQNGWDFAKNFNSRENSEYYSDVLTTFFPEWNPEQDYKMHLCDIWNQCVPKGYHGIQKEDGTSTQIHLDSIIKGDKPICYLSYNENGYHTHCRQYKEYKEWEKKRNPVRYESNLNKNYDSKNIMHCLRLTQMGVELAKTGKFNIVRTNDRDFLLDVRNHKYEYDDLLKIVMQKKQEMESLQKTCILPDDIDHDFVNDLLIQVRQMHSSNETILK